MSIEQEQLTRERALSDKLRKENDALQMYIERLTKDYKEASIQIQHLAQRIQESNNG